LTLLGKSQGLDGCSTSDLEKRAREVVDLFEPWLPTEVDHESKIEELTDLLVDTIKLSRQLRVQTAHWSIKHPGVDLVFEDHHMHSAGFVWYFDSTIMENSRGGEALSEQVEFVLWPALYKATESRDGLRTEKNIIKKSIVLCQAEKASWRRA
jgi:hypothetical protein